MLKVPIFSGGFPEKVKVFGLNFSQVGSGSPVDKVALTVISSPSASETLLHVVATIFLIPSPLIVWSAIVPQTGALFRFSTVNFPFPYICSA